MRTQGIGAPVVSMAEDGIAVVTSVLAIAVPLIGIIGVGGLALPPPRDLPPGRRAATRPTTLVAHHLDTIRLNL